MENLLKEQTEVDWALELAEQRLQLFSIGRTNGQQFRSACEVLRRQLSEVPSSFAARSQSLDTMVTKVEGRGELLIREYVPQGVQLRTLLSIGHIAGELRRIDREAVSLACCGVQLQTQVNGRAMGQLLHPDLQRLQTLVTKTLQASFTALENLDTRSAREASSAANAIKVQSQIAVRRLILHVTGDYEANLECGVILEHALRTFERIGEHCEKICELAAYPHYGKAHPWTAEEPKAWTQTESRGLPRYVREKGFSSGWTVSVPQ